MSPSKDPSTKCGRKNRKGKPCDNPKGYKTDHVGSGPCHFHGGAIGSGAPKGNKNAVTTGEYEKILYSALSEDEQALFDAQDEIDPRKEVERELKYIMIRQHRMQIRLRRAMRLEADSVDGMEDTSKTILSGFQPKGRVNTVEVQQATILSTVVALEDAISRISALKVRYIDQLRGILKENPPNSGGLEAIVKVLDRSAVKIAANREKADEYARELEEKEAAGEAP